MADDMEVKREIILEADAETIERMRKEGHARGFTVYCDEAERIGGGAELSPPIQETPTVDARPTSIGRVPARQRETTTAADHLAQFCLHSADGRHL